MQYSKIGELELSRLGLGTKRLPTTDRTHVVRVDTSAQRQIVHEAQALGINYVDTSYSDGKGEVESELGEDFMENGYRMHVSTSYFDMIDPRFDYVFNKQLKKLAADSIDLYHVEGVNNMVKDRCISSGAVDYLFQQKEAGRIANLGFSSQLNPENLKEMLARFPWDFVRMRINYFDWFKKDVRECYEVAAEAGIPILAHGALRTGAVASLKPDAWALLKEANPDRSECDWGLRFVKSLDAVTAVSVNVRAIEQLRKDAAVFDDDVVLNEDEIALLQKAAELQSTVKRVS